MGNIPNPHGQTTRPRVDHTPVPL
ncbi:hypothetical protein F383_34713 [Gossypium arboreum]|uniref:Uncharacterized protein n=1 Tax=Gossypium arboreum TaxID=29729 RepID=A0A0B0PR51_GOSAR|nr:hypothetical protein F383_34713 [Gossypium arboreum]